jgi:hypothetical protein
MDPKIRSNAHEVFVIRPMMNRAQTEAVADDRLAGFVRVTDDVRRIE